MRGILQRRPAAPAEPLFDPCEVPAPGRVRKIVRHGPDPHQQWKELGLRGRERVDKGSGPVVRFSARKGHQTGCACCTSIEIEKHFEQRLRPLSVASSSRFKAIWNFTDSLDSSHRDRAATGLTNDSRSPSSIARKPLPDISLPWPERLGIMDVHRVIYQVLRNLDRPGAGVDPLTQLRVEARPTDPGATLQQQRR